LESYQSVFLGYFACCPRVQAVHLLIQGALPLLPGARPMVPGVRLSIPGARPLLPGARPLLPGARSLLPGARSMLPGARPMPPSARPLLPSASPPIEAPAGVCVRDAYSRGPPYYCAVVPDPYEDLVHAYGGAGPPVRGACTPIQGAWECVRMHTFASEIDCSGSESLCCAPQTPAESVQRASYGAPWSSEGGLHPVRGAPWTRYVALSGPARGPAPTVWGARWPRYGAFGGPYRVAQHQPEATLTQTQHSASPAWKQRSLYSETASR
jgi:hypothetical protein